MSYITHLLAILWISSFATFELSASGGLETQEPCVLAEFAPNSFVNNTVNAIDGNFYFTTNDLQAPGATALNVQHYYNNQNSYDHWIGPGFSLNYSFSIADCGYNQENTQFGFLAVEASGGSIIRCIGKDDSKKTAAYLDPKILHEGWTNCGSYELSARTNMKNTYFTISKKKFWTGYFPDGTIREYTDSRSVNHVANVKHEKRPNKTQLDYEFYKTDFPKRITARGKHTHNWLHFDSNYKKRTNTITSSVGKKVVYKSLVRDGRLHLKSIESTDSPRMKFRYAKNGNFYSVDRISWPDNRFLEVEYDGKNRVTCQKAPVGENDKKRTIWHFDYHPDKHYTQVTDAYQRKRIYRYAKKRLTALEEFTENKLYRVHAYTWGQKSDISLGHHPKTKEGNLITEALLDGEHKAHYAHRFSYDEYGNVTRETLYGNLTGNAHASFTLQKKGKPERYETESYHKDYTYSDDQLHLKLTEKEDNGPSIEYRYCHGTDLMWAKFTSEGGKIIKREFFSYDDDSILTEKIVDDGSTHNKSCLTGVTERHITHIEPVAHNHDGHGLPHIVDESYLDLTTNKRVLLKRTLYNYNQAGKVIEEAIYNADRTYLYSSYYKYDEKNRLIKSINPLKETVSYEYDANNNKISECLEGSGFYTKFEYDKANRLVAEVQHHDDGQTVAVRHAYDLMSNKISSTDRYGHVTGYQYDELNRVIKIALPDNTSIERTYDLFDNVTSEKNQNGSATTYQYNARKQLTSTIYADNSQERFVYNHNGTLAHKWDQSGTKTSYLYDILGRVIQTDVCDASGAHLATTTNCYNSFHLLSTTDEMGYTTYFSYDAAGRKIQEYKEALGNFSKTTFEYDKLGRLSCTKMHSDTGYIATYIEYDALNRIISQAQKDTTGRCFNWNYFEYDIQGNCTLKRSSYADEGSDVRTWYNSQSEPIEQIDECGNSTKFVIDHTSRPPRKITTDALENSTEEHFDALFRTICVLKKNSHGKLLAQTDFYYNGTGKKTKQVEHVLIDDKVDHEYVITWEYDALDRIIKLTEQSNKITSYEYDIAGRLSILTKPDGVRLMHTYDALGRLTSLRSSDATIAYTYTYDLHNNPIQVVDEVTGYVTKRSYDAWNRLTADGVEGIYNVQQSFDAIGRQTELLLPDSSSVRYLYNEAYLAKVQRRSADKTLYEHSYKAFDMQGHVLESDLIKNLGTITLSWDKKSRNTAIKSPYFTQELPSDGFDAAGNLKHYSYTDQLGTVVGEYRYDDLYQLIQESGAQEHVYENDSVNNRRLKDSANYSLDEHNKVLSDGDSTFSYDKNGNPICMQAPDKIVRYTYDALNRLVKVDDGTHVTDYIYDSFNRRIIRISSDKTEYFLHQGLREIGTLVDGAMREFRVLGLGKGAELGASIAIELEEKVYAPLHDFRGNIVALVDTETGKVAESYRYTAFGECEMQGKPVGNPWRFASKRFDDETGFVYFSKRFYAPSLGRWITPDPLGFADGPNMYAYVHNNPMTRFDLYGLFGKVNEEAHHAGGVMMYSMVETVVVGSADMVLWAASGGRPDMDDSDECFSTGAPLKSINLYEILHDALHSGSNTIRDYVLGDAFQGLGSTSYQQAYEIGQSASMIGGFVVGGVGVVKCGFRWVSQGSNKLISSVKNFFAKGASGATASEMAVVQSSQCTSRTVQMNPSAQAQSNSSLTNPRPDFIVGANGTTVPTNRAILEGGFQRAGFPMCPTRSPGTQYTMPNGNLARIMEPSGPAGLRLSYTNPAEGPISPFTQKPVHSPRNLSGISRKDYIRERTHVELTE